MRGYAVLAVATALAAWGTVGRGQTAVARTPGTASFMHRTAAGYVEESVTMKNDPRSRTTSGWRTYRNRRAGYEISYPATWSARQQSDTAGTLTTFFVRPGHNGGVSISVIKDNGAIGSGRSDIPNTHCFPVAANGFTGKRCLDTFSRHISFIFSHAGKSYYITAVGKNFNNDILNSMLGTFRLI